jgi:hypothetical protein
MNSIDAGLLARCYAALLLAEKTLIAPGQAIAWLGVMQARVQLEYALGDLPPVQVTAEVTP